MMIRLGLAILLVTACGDKYLNVGLGTHYRRSAAERQAAAVLVYASPGSELARLLSALSVETAMNKAGYRPALATSTTELEAALRLRKWDVIVVDGRDAQAVAPRLPKPSAPHLVPVLGRATKEEVKQAEKAYETVVKAPTRTSAFVDAVDDAVDLHEIEARAAAKKGAKGATR